MRPTIRATVVLPVPGGPANTKCRICGGLGSPCRSRILATRSWAAIACTCRLTGSSPTIRSRSASASSRVGRVLVAAVAGRSARRRPWSTSAPPMVTRSSACGCAARAHHPHVAGLRRGLHAGCGRSGRCPARRPSRAGGRPRSRSASSTGRASARQPVAPAPLRAASVICEQLVGGVAGEADPGGEPAGQAGVGGQERRRLLLVAGQDDDQPVAVVLGPLEQRLHGLRAEPVGLAVAGVDQAVGLVDEQHPAERPSRPARWS